MKLSELTIQETGIIKGFSNDLPEEHQRRLRELGFCEGLSVVLVRPTPWGGPPVFRVADAIFSLDPWVTLKIMIERDL